MRCIEHNGVPILFEIAPASLRKGHRCPLHGRAEVFAHIDVPGIYIAQTSWETRAPKGLDAVVRKYVAQGFSAALQVEVAKMNAANMRATLLADLRAADHGDNPIPATMPPRGRVVLPTRRGPDPGISEGVAQRPAATVSRPEVPQEAWEELRRQPWTHSVSDALLQVVFREVVPCADELLGALVWYDPDAYNRVAQEAKSSAARLEYELPCWFGRRQSAQMAMVELLLYTIWGAHHLAQQMPDDHAGLVQVLRMAHEHLVSLLVVSGLVLEPMDAGVHTLIANCLIGTAKDWRRVGELDHQEITHLAEQIVYSPEEKPKRNPRGVGFSPKDVLLGMLLRKGFVDARVSDPDIYGPSLACPPSTYDDIHAVRSDNDTRSIQWDEHMSCLAEAIYPLAWAIDQASQYKPVTLGVGSDEPVVAWSATIRQVTSHLCALLMRRVWATDDAGQNLAAAVMSIIDEACVLWLAATTLDDSGNARPYTDVDHGKFASQALVSYWALMFLLRTHINRHMVRAGARAMNLELAMWLEECPLPRPEHFAHHTGLRCGPGSARGMGLIRVLVRGHGGQVSTDAVSNYIARLLQQGANLLSHGLSSIFADGGNVLRDGFPNPASTHLVLDDPSELEKILYPRAKT